MKVRIADCGLRILPFVVLLGVSASSQSLSYSKGQNVAPGYEGWEQDAAGVKYFVFGYMNRNWEEEVDVPIGPDNGFNLGGVDQGQPTQPEPLGDDGDGFDEGGGVGGVAAEHPDRDRPADGVGEQPVLDLRQAAFAVA